MNTCQLATPDDEPIETALAVLHAGWASLEEVADAVSERRSQRPAIGRLLLSHRKLTMRQVFEVLKEQASSPKRFGEIAVEKGFVTESDISEMLWLQSLLCPTLLDVLISRKVVTAEQAEWVFSSTQTRTRHTKNERLAECCS
jgi:hypothetical protein